jgi:acyl carrier protein
VAPRDAVERTVAAIWSQVLGLEQVGVHDNFFDLGGHSLLATRVFARLQKAFSVPISLRDLFEKPTVAELSGAIGLRTTQIGRSASILPVSRDAIATESVGAVPGASTGQESE